MVDQISTLTNTGYELGEPQLKLVPSPYDKDHPEGPLLRRKGCVLWNDLPSDTDDLTAAVSHHFAAFAPFTAALRAI